MNLLTSNLDCVECGCSELIKDYNRQEIYCSNCGLVLADTTIPGIADVEKEIQEEQTKTDYYTLRRFLYDMEFMQDSFTCHSALK